MQSVHADVNQKVKMSGFAWTALRMSTFLIDHLAIITKNAMQVKHSYAMRDAPSAANLKSTLVSQVGVQFNGEQHALVLLRAAYHTMHAVTLGQALNISPGKKKFSRCSLLWKLLPPLPERWSRIRPGGNSV